MSINASRAIANPITRTITALPQLGVGLLYNPSLPGFLHDNLDCLDYLEIIPDMFWTDQGRGQSPRYIELESWVDFLSWIMEHRPVIAHSIGLSLGSADTFDVEYLDHLRTWHERYHFIWHSDHLSFFKVGGIDGGKDHNAGLAMPIPHDFEVLDLITSRVKHVQHTIETPLLIENNVYYVDIPDQDLSEAEFLNRLSHGTGCGILLDVHNLYANARNHGFDPREFLNELDLTRVVEVHIAGGSELAGMYTDSHSGPCPDPVWELLEEMVPRAPNLCGITFEFHDSYYHVLKSDGIRAELGHARKIWDRYRS
jgi:uncharacterized protein